MPVPHLDIDRSSPVPLYFQISTRLEAAVDCGDLAPGEMLPNEIAFSETLGISRPTMRRALDELVEKGILTRKRGVGSRITSEKVRRRVALTSLFEDLAGVKRSPTTTVLRFDPEHTDAHAARALGEPARQPLVYFERLRFADGMPLALMRNWLPPRFRDITAEELTRTGLYQLLGQRRSRPSVANERISAQPADSAVAKLLGIRRNAPLIAMQRTAYDSVGHAVEYGDHLYRADLYAIEVTVFSR